MRRLRECDDIVVNLLESSYMLHAPIFNKLKVVGGGGDDDDDNKQQQQVC